QRRAGEARRAAPVERSVARAEGRAVAVREQAVVGDGLEIRGGHAPFVASARGFVTGVTPASVAGTTGAMTSRVAEVDAHEGPVYVADENALYFTSVPHRNGGGIPVVAIKRLDLASGRISIVRPEAN